ncbi:4-hydroxybenzoate polyprenyltransferase [hydrothermal vent metagenome]|uniref:4-hydroxybenzoate polyprenyltransferase n=1 Tax=hydrothermal vent metagenome TaxID=652676 RepID=A0A3B0TR88_9ZZZZ
MKSSKNDQSDTGRVADAQDFNWVDNLAPRFARPYLRLARLDRPIGFWLLFWPCAISLVLAALASPALGFSLWSLVLFLAGAIVMRGAGCTFNDIIDQKIDQKVARTRSRPLPSGQVTRLQALIFLLAQLLAGLVILIQFNSFTIWLGVASLILVIIYPFMKRITWWPQLFLGLAFSWGALIGWASGFGQLSLPPLLLYLGAVLWTIGYDTIYALQDIEDDALIGVKSTARLFGSNARPLVGLFYLGAFLLWVLAGWQAGGGAIFLAAMALPAALLIWQVASFKPENPANCLRRFKANHYVGLAVTLALLIEFWF